MPGLTSDDDIASSSPTAAAAAHLDEAAAALDSATAAANEAWSRLAHLGLQANLLTRYDNDLPWSGRLLACGLGEWRASARSEQDRASRASARIACRRTNSCPAEPEISSGLRAVQRATSGPGPATASRA